MKNKQVAAVVLAAGKGSRINAKEKNKVMFPLNGKPMIGYTIDTLKKLQLNKIIAVIGFAADTVKKYLGKRVEYAVQEKRLGTAHAVKQAIPLIPDNVKYLLVLNGDDSAFYPFEKLQNLIDFHKKEKSKVTILTVHKNNPYGYGRIIRNGDRTVKAIIEEKHATKEQKKIKEINTACYCFDCKYLQKILPKIEKNSQSKEYYLTEAVQIAAEQKQKVSALKLDSEKYFQGINTHEQWQKANNYLINNKND